MSMINVLITCKDSEEAKSIAGHLLELRLVVCANFFPIESLYLWDEEIKGDKEFALLLKTKRDHYDEIIKEVLAIHSYETPLIEYWNIDGINEGYFEWFNREIAK